MFKMIKAIALYLDLEYNITLKTLPKNEYYKRYFTAIYDAIYRALLSFMFFSTSEYYEKRKICYYILIKNYLSLF